VSCSAENDSGGKKAVEMWSVLLVNQTGVTCVIYLIIAFLLVVYILTFNKLNYNFCLLGNFLSKEIIS
jgi:hypothetical protein